MKIYQKILLLIAPIPIAIAALVSSAFDAHPPCACESVNRSGQSNVNRLLYAQLFYYFDQGNFTRSIDTLKKHDDIYLERASRYYQFSIDIDEDKVFVDATPLQTDIPIDRFKLGIHTLPFHSTVGGMVFQNGEYKSMICQSQIPTTTKPPKLEWVNDQFQCPANFESIKEWGKM